MVNRREIQPFRGQGKCWRWLPGLILFRELGREIRFQGFTEGAKIARWPLRTPSSRQELLVKPLLFKHRPLLFLRLPAECNLSRSIDTEAGFVQSLQHDSVAMCLLHGVCTIPLHHSSRSLHLKPLPLCPRIYAKPELFISSSSS